MSNVHLYIEQYNGYNVRYFQTVVGLGQKPTVTLLSQGEHAKAKARRMNLNITHTEIINRKGY